MIGRSIQRDAKNQESDWLLECLPLDKGATAQRIRYQTPCLEYRAVTDNSRTSANAMAVSSW